MHSCIFTGYVEQVPVRDSNDIISLPLKGYEFYIHLISIREDTRDEVKDLPLPNLFKIRAYCPGAYKEEKDDQYAKIDETLRQSLMASIHVGDLIEFRGTAYKFSKNRVRLAVIPQLIQTAHEIEMDRHYIRIMPSNKESLKRYDAYVKAEEDKKSEEKKRIGNGNGTFGKVVGGKRLKENGS